MLITSLPPLCLARVRAYRRGPPWRSKTDTVPATDPHGRALSGGAGVRHASERTADLGLAWQQGPLAPGAAGTFLVAEPLPERLLYAEPLRRRMRVQFDGAVIAQSDDVVLLHEPGRYPVAYFPLADVAEGVLLGSERRTDHPELGATSWYAVR